MNTLLYPFLIAICLGQCGCVSFIENTPIAVASFLLDWWAPDTVIKFVSPWMTDLINVRGNRIDDIKCSDGSYLNSRLKPVLETLLSSSKRPETPRPVNPDKYIRPEKSEVKKALLRTLNLNKGLDDDVVDYMVAKELLRVELPCPAGIVWGRKKQGDSAS